MSKEELTTSQELHTSEECKDDRHAECRDTVYCPECDMVDLCICDCHVL